MKTIDIKGKPYVMVNERLKEFRANYKGWSLTSEIVSLSADSCVIKATICDENGVIKATGYAQEDKTSSMINKTSFVENCETSAWGRALGCLGIGIDDNIASAEEVNMAIKKQEVIEKSEKAQNVIDKIVNAPAEKTLTKDNYICEECQGNITEKVAKYSLEKFGKCLCFDCQKLSADLNK